MISHSPHRHPYLQRSNNADGDSYEPTGRIPLVKTGQGPYARNYDPAPSRQVSLPSELVDRRAALLGTGVIAVVAGIAGFVFGLLIS